MAGEPGLAWVEPRAGRGSHGLLVLSYREFSAESVALARCSVFQSRHSCIDLATRTERINVPIPPNMIPRPAPPTEGTAQFVSQVIRTIAAPIPPPATAAITTANPITSFQMSRSGGRLLMRSELVSSGMSVSVFNV